MSKDAQNEIANFGSVSEWLDGLAHGASEAQHAIWIRYVQQLVRYADSRLRSLGVRSGTGEDIVQQVFVGFFRRAAAGQFPDLNDRYDLWRALVRITNDRVIDARRKKVPLTESAFDDKANSSADTLGIARVSDNQPTPEMGYAICENLRNLITRMDQRHPELKQIAALRLAGYSVAQIADQFKTPIRTVERRLEWIQQIWDQYHQELTASD